MPHRNLPNFAYLQGFDLARHNYFIIISPPVLLKKLIRRIHFILLLLLPPFSTSFLSPPLFWILHSTCVGGKGGGGRLSLRGGWKKRGGGGGVCFDRLVYAVSMRRKRKKKKKKDSAVQTPPQFRITSDFLLWQNRAGSFPWKAIARFKNTTLPPLLPISIPPNQAMVVVRSDPPSLLSSHQPPPLAASVHTTYVHIRKYVHSMDAAVAAVFPKPTSVSHTYVARKKVEYAKLKHLSVSTRK